VSGPNGSKSLNAVAAGTYLAELSAKGATPFLSPGTYTLSNGAGGSDIGPFTANVNVPQALIWTNESSIKSVSASQNLRVTWSGGTACDFVSIFGTSGLPSISKDTQFFCNAPAGDGQFTIPSQVFALLPPAGVGSNGLPGTDFIVALITPGTFSAPGLDYGILFSSVTVSTVLGINP
jgi:hypothetical protein